jgi:uncharacterized repeat protein (TIGR01451 family)
MKRHEQELSKLLFSTALSVVLPLLAVVCLSVQSLAQLDPRERYGTYLGGSKADCVNDRALECGTAAHNYFPATNYASAVAVDSSGNVYVAGYTDAVDFPTTSGAYRRTANYQSDGFNSLLSKDSFAMKFNANGQLVWSTYLGIPLLTCLPGSPLDCALKTITVDASGNVVLVGRFRKGSSRYYSGSNAAFILKLNSTGSALAYYNEVFDLGECGEATWATAGDAAAVDSSGRIYIVGEDATGDCVPATTSGANQTGTGYLIKVDTTKATNHGIVYVARTADRPLSVAVGGVGLAYVTGGETSTAGQGTYVTKFNSVGAVSYSVNYLNSFGYGSGNAIRTTATGDVIFTGTASAYDLPSTANFGTSTTGTEVFIARLNSTGGLVYSAIIHDPNMIPSALALNSANEPFLTGALSASSFRVNPYSNAPVTGAFLTRLNSLGTALWLDSAFGGHYGTAIAIDPAWNAFVVGTSLSGDYFPMTANAFQSSFKGASSQGFFSKLIIEADLKLTASASPNPVAHGTNLTYTFAVLNNGPDVSDGDTLTDALPSGTTFVSFSTTSGTCTHPAVGSSGTFKCSRTSPLLKAHSWGPIKLTVRVNAASGTTLTNTAKVSAKTQDVFQISNTKTVSVKVN